MSSPAGLYAHRPAAERDKIRQTLALEALKTNLLMGGGRSDEEILAQYDYRHPDDYWRVWTSATMKVSAFVHVLAILSSDPAKFSLAPDGSLVTEVYLKHAIQEANITNVPWLIKDRKKPDDDSKVRLCPRDAARWLLKQEKWATLVPEGLRAFIERMDNPDSPKRLLRAKAGAPPAADWDAHAAALALECKQRGCVPPDPEGPKRWRKKADVERWTHDWLADRGDKAAPSTVRAHVNEALQKIVLENGQK